jgi:hypothetical protein
MFGFFPFGRTANGQTGECQTSLSPRNVFSCGDGIALLSSFDRAKYERDSMEFRGGSAYDFRYTLLT